MRNFVWLLVIIGFTAIFARPSPIEPKQDRPTPSPAPVASGSPRSAQLGGQADTRHLSFYIHHHQPRAMFTASLGWNAERQGYDFHLARYDRQRQPSQDPPRASASEDILVGEAEGDRMMNELKSLIDGAKRDEASDFVAWELDSKRSRPQQGLPEGFSKSWLARRWKALPPSGN